MKEGSYLGKSVLRKKKKKKEIVSVPPKRLFTPLINLFKINALGALKCVAAWQICKTFLAKLLITRPVFFLLPFPSIRPFQNSSHTRDPQSEQTIGMRVGSGGGWRGGLKGIAGRVAITEPTQTISRPLMSVSGIGLHERDARGNTHHKHTHIIRSAMVATSSLIFFLFVLQVLFMPQKDRLTKKEKKR